MENRARRNQNFNIKSLVISKNALLILGMGLVLLAAVFEALADVLPKPLMNDSEIIPLNPIVLVTIIYLLNGVMFTPLTKGTQPFKKLGRNMILLLTGIGVVEVLSTIFFLYGLKDTSAVNAAIIGNSEIFFGVVIAMLVLGERLQRKEFLPFAMIALGAIILPLSQDFGYGTEPLITEFTMGDFLVLTSGLLLGILMTLYRYVSNHVDSKRIIQYTSFIGAGIAILALFLFGIPFEFDYEHLPTISFIGIIGVGIPAFFVILALKIIGAVRTILIFASTTVFAVLFANLFLGEIIGFDDIASIMLVIAGIYILRQKLTKF